MSFFFEKITKNRTDNQIVNIYLENCTILSSPIWYPESTLTEPHYRDNNFFCENRLISFTKMIRAFKIGGQIRNPLFDIGLLNLNSVK